MNINISIQKHEGQYIAYIQPLEVGAQGQACAFPDLLTLILALGMKLQDFDSGREAPVIVATEQPKHDNAD